jgi:hypothetical protein
MDEYIEKEDYYNISEKRRIQEMLENPGLGNTDGLNLSKDSVRKYDRFVSEDSLEEADSDEILIENGFYDTTDKRCCVNRNKL